MEAFTPRNAAWSEATRENFARQGAMGHLGAELRGLEPGYCEIAAAYRAELSQQNGFFHAGILTTLADSAGGYAAYTLFPAGSDVLTVEFKINFMEPAAGESIIACGRVLRAGKKITTAQSEVWVIAGERRTRCAIMLMTLAQVGPRPS